MINLDIIREEIHMLEVFHGGETNYTRELKKLVEQSTEEWRKKWGNRAEIWRQANSPW